MKPNPIIYWILGSSLMLVGCPQPLTPTPIPSSSASSPPCTDARPCAPTPSPSPSPTATPSPIPEIPTIPAPLLGDFYRVEFGPGSKGFGFGPGSKGFKNVVFQINFDTPLVRPDILPFQIQQAPTLLNEVTLEIIKQNELVATVKVKPAAAQIRFESYLAPGIYHLRSAARGNFADLTMTNGQIEVLDGFHAEIRMMLHDRQANPAGLDIEILTRNRLVATKAVNK